MRHVGIVAEHTLCLLSRKFPECRNNAAGKITTTFNLKFPIIISHFWPLVFHNDDNLFSITQLEDIYKYYIIHILVAERVPYLKSGFQIPQSAQK